MIRKCEMDLQSVSRIHSLLDPHKKRTVGTALIPLPHCCYVGLPASSKCANPIIVVITFQNLINSCSDTLCVPSYIFKNLPLAFIPLTN